MTMDKTHIIDTEEIKEFKELEDCLIPKKVEDCFEINIEGQKCSKGTAKQLCRIIRNARVLGKLNLQGCFGKTNLFSDVLKSILHNEDLKDMILDIRANQFDKECGDVIAQLIANKKMLTLKLPRIVSDEIAERILKVFKKSGISLLEFDISRSLLNRASLNLLYDLLQRGKITECLNVELCVGWENGRACSLTRHEHNHLKEANPSSILTGKPEIKWQMHAPGEIDAIYNPTSSHKDSFAPKEHSTGDVIKLVAKEQTEKIKEKVKSTKIYKFFSKFSPNRKRTSSSMEESSEAKTAKVEVVGDNPFYKTAESPESQKPYGFAQSNLTVNLSVLNDAHGERNTDIASSIIKGESRVDHTQHGGTHHVDAN